MSPKISVSITVSDQGMNYYIRFYNTATLSPITCVQWPSCHIYF